jgi:hypothetical protein
MDNNYNSVGIPKFIKIGQTKRCIVWSVDDGWFEGGKEDFELPITESLEIDLDFNGNLQDILLKINDLKIFAREEKIAIPLSLELEYLETVTLLCNDYQDLQLCLCNFEYFERNFEEINKIGDFILLDIYYATLELSNTKTNDFYGVDLLYNLLDGSSPKANTVFLTVAPGKVTEYQGECWRAGSRLINENNLKITAARKSDAAQRLKLLFDSTKLTTGCMAQIFKIAHCLEQSTDDKIGHASNYEDICNLPGDWPLREAILESRHYKSFTAIYYWKEARNIKASIFIEHLNYFGFEVRSDLSSQFLKMPIYPGGIFIAHIGLFLKCLMEDQNSTNLVLNLTVKENESILTIPLDYEEAEIFDDAIIVGGGKLVDKFRSLMACKKEFLFEYFGSNTEKISFLDKWQHPNRAKGEGTTKYKRALKEYSIDIDHNAKSACLNLSWEYTLDISKSMEEGNSN